MLRLLIEGDPVGAVLAAAKLASAKLRRARGVSDSLTYLGYLPGF